MIFTFEERPSDSPFVERIWRAHSERAGSFLSVAASHWEMVVTRQNGKTMLTVRGPETKATPLDCSADGEWLGIRFKLGTVMPHLPASNLVDGAVNLPDAGSRSFWLHRRFVQLVTGIFEQRSLLLSTIAESTAFAAPIAVMPRTSGRSFAMRASA